MASYTDTDPEWPLMQYTIQTVMQAIQTAFPGVPILPVIGNNDVQYHNQAPNATDAPSYYADMWQLYVTEVAANSASFTATQLATFSTGGYYSYQIPGSQVTVICLNGMYPFYENNNEQQLSSAMITWVET